MTHKISISCLLIIFFIAACNRQKSNLDRAIELVEQKYQGSVQKIDFNHPALDTLYTISPKAYADSIQKGNELDSVLAVLESQIEHFDQKESDSVGLVSAELTKQRYRLLELVKHKPEFKGWRLSGVSIGQKTKDFEFDKAITKIHESDSR